jgi:hypothetical protein
MATGNILAEGNIDRVSVVTQLVDLGSCAANTTTTLAITLPGVLPGDWVWANFASPTAGVGIVNARVSTANTITIEFGNFTAAPIDPTASNVRLLIVRTDAVRSGSF